MAKTSSTLALIFGFIFTLSIQGQMNAYENPGVKIKIYPRGLDLARDFLVDFVETKINSAKIPSLSGKNYLLSKIQLTSFNSGQTSFSTTSPNVFAVTINEASISAQADFKVWKKFWFFTLKKSGSISAYANGVTITQSISISRNSNGKPTFLPKNCQTSISTFRAKVKAGILGRIFNSLLSLFRKKIQRKIEDKICPLIKDQLRTRLLQVTNNFDVNFPLIYDIWINLGLVRPPVARANSLTVSMNGRCYKKGDFLPIFPYRSAYLPPFSTCSKTAQIQVSEYTLNTLFFTLWKCNRLNLTVSAEQIYKVLNTNLTAGDLAQFIPSFKKFPSTRPLEVVLGPSSSPKVSFSESGINAQGSYNVTVNVVLENGNKQQAIAISADVHIEVNPTVNNGIISGSVTNLTAVATSASGFPVEYINEIFNAALPSLILPAINEVTKSGFKIPDFYNYSSKGIMLITKQNVIEICADFN